MNSKQLADAGKAVEFPPFLQYAVCQYRPYAFEADEGDGIGFVDIDSGRQGAIFVFVAVMPGIQGIGNSNIWCKVVVFFSGERIQSFQFFFFVEAFAFAPPVEEDGSGLLPKAQFAEAGAVDSVGVEGEEG